MRLPIVSAAPLIAARMVACGPAPQPGPTTPNATGDPASDPEQPPRGKAMPFYDAQVG